MNASLINYQSQTVRGPVPQVAATKAGAPDMCIGSFPREIGEAWSGLEGEGRGGVCGFPGLWGGCSQLPDAC